MQGGLGKAARLEGEGAGNIYRAACLYLDLLFVGGAGGDYQRVKPTPLPPPTQSPGFGKPERVALFMLPSVKLSLGGDKPACHRASPRERRGWREVVVEGT